MIYPQQMTLVLYQILLPREKHTEKRQEIKVLEKGVAVHRSSDKSEVKYI